MAPFGTRKTTVYTRFRHYCFYTGRKKVQPDYHWFFFTNIYIKTGVARSIKRHNSLLSYITARKSLDMMNKKFTLSVKFMDILHIHTPAHEQVKKLLNMYKYTPVNVCIQNKTFFLYADRREKNKRESHRESKNYRESHTFDKGRTFCKNIRSSTSGPL